MIIIFVDIIIINTGGTRVARLYGSQAHSWTFQITYHSPSRLVPDYIKSSLNEKKMIGKSKSTMQYNSGQYATVTHYRRGGQDRGTAYQNRSTAPAVYFSLISYQQH